MTVYDAADAARGGGFPYSQGPIGNAVITYNSSGTQSADYVEITPPSGASFGLALDPAAGLAPGAPSDYLTGNLNVSTPSDVLASTVSTQFVDGSTTYDVAIENLGSYGWGLAIYDADGLVVPVASEYLHFDDATDALVGAPSEQWRDQPHWPVLGEGRCDLLRFRRPDDQRQPRRQRARLGRRRPDDDQRRAFPAAPST